MILDERFTTYLDSLNWQLPQYLKELEREALQDQVPVIRRSTQSLLGFLVSLRKPGRVLEIGTAVGFSALLMREYAGSGTKIDTIEKVPMRLEAAKKNFEIYDTTNAICQYQGDAFGILEELVKEKKNYDFIFMDAAKGQYLNFLAPVLELLAEDGMLVTDNVLQDGDIIQSRYAIAKRDRTIHGRMRKYLYTLTHSEQLNTIILPVGDGVSLSVFRKLDEEQS